MPLDPFAGSDAARDDLASATAILRADPGLNLEQIAAAETLVAAGVSDLKAGQEKAEKAVAIAEKIAGFIKNPSALRAILGL